MTDNDVALIIEQNRQTHAAIASLTEKFEAHVVEDRRQQEVLFTHGEDIRRHERYFVHAGRFAKFMGITAIGALLAKLGIK